MCESATVRINHFSLGYQSYQFCYRVRIFLGKKSRVMRNLEIFVYRSSLCMHGCTKNSQSVGQFHFQLVRSLISATRANFEAIS